ncbi:hypothetical protein EV424DRAFT_1594842 [Suillus variegatus]|nr:hypothetical protein EV424DRAFT_1594842 [Suillus variegatus]
MISRLRARIPKFHETKDDTTAAFKPGSVLAINLGKNKSSPVESPDDFVTARTYPDFGMTFAIILALSDDPSAVFKIENYELEPSPITARRPRLVLKVAPDLEESQIIDIAGPIRKSNIDGVIVSNTTISHPASLTDRGLSGAPLKPRALQALKTLRGHVPESIPLLGCRGISTGADALDYARAGASLVQVHTGFGYDGVGTCRHIKDELEALLRAENTTWKAVVDESVRKLSLTES